MRKAVMRRKPVVQYFLRVQKYVSKQCEQMRKAVMSGNLQYSVKIHELR